METLLVLAVVAALVVAGATVSSRQRARQQELEAGERFAAVEKVVNEDVTRFGEELTELHIDTMTTTLDTPMRQDYQRALDCYENAKQLQHDAGTPEDLSEVTKVLEDGRYAQACVLARQAGRPLPRRRPPCFFNPAHGPALVDVEWAPVGGAAREIPVCLADAERVRAGAEPDARQVRAGNRMVPWYQGGPTYAPYAHGYYGSYAANGLFPGFLLGAMMAGTWAPPAYAGGEDWSGEPGAGDPGGDLGDGGGFDGGGFDGGGFDGGGFDGGGFDIGGF